MAFISTAHFQAYRQSLRTPSSFPELSLTPSPSPSVKRVTFQTIDSGCILPAALQLIVHTPALHETFPLGHPIQKFIHRYHTKPYNIMAIDSLRARILAHLAAPDRERPQDATSTLRDLFTSFCTLEMPSHLLLILQKEAGEVAEKHFCELALSAGQRHSKFTLDAQFVIKKSYEEKNALADIYFNVTRFLCQASEGDDAKHYTACIKEDEDSWVLYNDAHLFFLTDHQALRLLNRRSYLLYAEPALSPTPHVNIAQENQEEEKAAHLPAPSLAQAKKRKRATHRILSLEEDPAVGPLRHSSPPRLVSETGVMTHPQNIGPAAVRPVPLSFSKAPAIDLNRDDDISEAVRQHIQNVHLKETPQ